MPWGAASLLLMRPVKPAMRLCWRTEKIFDNWASHPTGGGFRSSQLRKQDIGDLGETRCSPGLLLNTANLPQEERMGSLEARMGQVLDALG